jgi:hypothetical protein
MRTAEGFIKFKVSEDDIEWAERAAREDQEYFSHQAVADERLTEAETEWVGCACGSSLSDLAPSQLELLANRHLDTVMEIKFGVRFIGLATGSSDWREVAFSEGRLEALRHRLGDETFRAAIAENDEGWKRGFAEAEEEERTLTPCLACGDPRTSWRVSDGDPRICGGCAHKVWQAEFGSCVSCGGARELIGSYYTDGRCEDCAVRELAPCRKCGGERCLLSAKKGGGLCLVCLDQQFGTCADCGRQLTYAVAELGRATCSNCESLRRDQEPCPKCGGHRDRGGSAYTGDLCWQCAAEQQPPCARCGSRLRLACDEGDICWPCRVNRHFNLTACPST